MLLATPSTQPTPPARWTSYWRDPLVSFEYQPTDKIASDALWSDGWLPASRTITGDRSLTLAFGGATLDEAVRAAKAISAQRRSFEIDAAGGARLLLEVNPAIAVLHDAPGKAYWLAPLEASVRVGGEWVGGSHTVDGPAFDGPEAAFRGVRVLTAVKDLVAVVGRDHVLTPERVTS